nr:ribonuclease H-like domain-containing protein [Tanacetum cinerariifolium]
EATVLPAEGTFKLVAPDAFSTMVANLVKPAQAHLATINYNPQLASAHNTHPVTTSQQYPIGLPGPTGFYTTSAVPHAQPHQPVLPSYPTSPAYLPQATMLPQAFQTMTLQEPNWNMDTGARKYNADGSLSRYKARLVANGRSQQYGIDCDETFCLVVKLATIRTVLSLAVSRNWPIHQFDVKNAFLHGQLSKTRIITKLHSEFAMTDLGSLNYFLGISAQGTPVDTESKLGSDGGLVSDPTLYRSLAGTLQYLTFTRPDISYDVQQVCLYMHDPREPHFTALKRILRYVRGTITFGLQLYASSTAQLTACTYADWDGCPVTRRSTSRYCVFLGDNLLSWFAKRHVALSRSSAEAEYRGVTNVVAETAWLRNLLLELHAPSPQLL